MNQFLFCTNADCNNLLSDYELSKIGKNTNGIIKGNKFKFCIKCRRNQQVMRIRCVKCRNIFDPVSFDDNGSSSGSIYRIYCDDCTHENNKKRSLEQYYRLMKNPEYKKKRAHLSKIRHLQRQGRLPKEMP